MIRKVNRRGERRLLIDITYTTNDGTKKRLRRDAAVQTMAAATAEERRYLANIAAHGSPFEPKPERVATPAASVTFGDVVKDFTATYMVTDLKLTTRRGYQLVLDLHLLPRFRDTPVAKVDGAAASKLDLDLTKAKLKKSTRNNVQIILRSVLRFAVDRKHLGAMPDSMPRLKKPEPSILEIPTDEQVRTILSEASPSQRRAFALMAYAGLRPNEVRALLRRDVKLKPDGTGGFLAVREGLSYGETHTPKTGRREVPIARPLALLLVEVEKGPREGHVAATDAGKPWGQYGLDQAFKRVRDRAGLAGWSVYSLRHYAITMWLRRGVPAHVVQKMAGHSSLTTTMHYVHHLKADLEDAARRLDDQGHSEATPSATSPEAAKKVA
jgi:integrase